MKSFLRLFFFAILLSFFSFESNARVLNAFISFQNPSCFGATDGFVTIDSLVIDTSGPSGPYVISINTTPQQFFNVGDTIFNLRSGSFSITIVDLADFTQLFPRPSFVITEPFQISTLLISNPPSCFGECDGSATAFIGNGTPPYTVLWSDPLSQDSTTAVGLCDGQYFITVTDANSCSVVDSVTVNEPSQIQPGVVVSDVLCNGDSSGSATALPSGGTGSYTNYDWSSSGNNTATENNLSQGTYTVTVTDSDGCTNEETFVVNEPAVLDISLSKSDVFCFGESTGGINSNPSGGTTPYTYAWSDGPSPNQNRTNLPAGTYTVTITDNNSCTDTASITINQRPAITLALTKTDILCNGDNSGEVTAIIGGGTPNFSFAWSNTVSGSGDSTTINNLLAGMYTITVTDALSCTLVDSIEVLQPPALSITPTSIVDPSCVGDNDGAIDITVSGGAPAYTYLWNDSITTEDRSNLTAGTYTVTVTDNNSCTEVFSTTLTDPAPIVPTVTTSDATCFGGNDGTAVANPSGGSGVYTNYQWSSNGSNNTANESNLSAGTYTVTVTDNNSCTGTETFTINQPASAISVPFTKSDVFCFGDSTGSINTNPIGGTPPYTYTWSDGPSTNQNRNTLLAGTYTVTVTDNNLCTGTASITINSRPAINITFSNLTNNLCNGGNSGSVTATFSGGTPNFSYAWSNATSGSGSSSTINNLTAGTYTITVTDALSCTEVDSVTITEPSAITINVASQTDPLCNGSSDGSIDIDVSGGTAPYTYLWNDTPTTEDRTNISSGTYTVTVTDNNNCTNTETIVLNDPPLLTASIDSINDASCSGLSDGFASAQGVGGAPPYSYAWSNGPLNRVNPNIPAGTYTVTITDDNSCTATTTAVVGQPITINSSLTETDISCNGADDGQIVANISGGTTPYTFNWGPGNPNGQGTNTISNLSPGTYRLTVTDVNGCNEVDSVSISEPAVLSLSTTVVDADCNGASTGEITVNVSGGTPVYSYAWNDPSNQTTATATNLPAGTYMVTVTDNNNCSDSIAATVNEPSAITASINSSTDPSCNGGNDGSATVTASGGTGTLSYLWSDPASQTTPTATGLTAGTFTVTVTDSNSCSTTAQVTLSEPTPLTINQDSLANVSCNGDNDGFISVSGSGGTPNYTFNWNGGIPGNSRSGLTAGSYTVTITDANSCTNTQTFTITEPNVLAVSLNTTDQQCSGISDGEITANPSGGTSPYTYLWSDPSAQTTATATNLDTGTYTVTVTDINGCSTVANATVDSASSITINTISTDVNCNGGNDGGAAAFASGGAGGFTYSWSTPGTGAIQSNLSAGIYFVTVTDANNCTAIDSVTINEPPTSVSVSINSSTDVSCFGANDGAATATASGGTGSLSYEWSTTPIQTTATASNLAGGTYTVTVTDDNSCTATTSITINEPTDISIAFSITNVLCNNDSTGGVTASFSGGTAPYNYSWSTTANGNGNNSTLSNLTAGTYFITVTDDSSCVKIDSVTISEPTALSIAVDAAINPSCNGRNDGSIDISVTGGTPSYSYEWSDTIGGPVGNIAPLATITADGSNGGGCRTGSCSTLNDLSFGTCGTQQMWIATANPPTSAIGTDFIQWDFPSPQTFDSLIIHHGQSNTRSLTGALVQRWDGTAWVNHSNFSNLPQQCINRVSIGRMTASRFRITQFLMTAPGQSSNPNFREIEIISAPISTSQDRSNLTAGTYTVTVTDDNGCTAEQSIVLNEPDSLKPVLSITDENCASANGAASASASLGGTPPYSYNWGPGSPDGQGTDSIFNLSAGTYFLTLTDDNGCDTIVSFDINSSGSNYTFIDSIVNNRCNGDSLGSIEVFGISGGTAPYSFNWGPGNPNGQGTNMITDLAAGSYTLTLTDDNNCDSIVNFNITEPTPINTNISTNDETCSPGGNGNATATVNGGTPPYSYNWGPGNPDGQGTDSIFNLSASNYSLTITDDNGCQDTLSFTINPGGNIALNETIADVDCNGDSTGSITLSPSGGVAPYTFVWDDASNNFFRTALAAGSYTVTVTDNNSCSRIESFSITQPTAVSPNLITEDADCATNNGTAKASPVGGTPPYSFNWGPGSPTGQGTDSISGLSAGNYSLTITDDNSCDTILNFMINSVGSGFTFIDSIVNNRCNGNNLGSIEVFGISGGTAPYSFNWGPGNPNGQGTNMITDLAAGSYTLTLTDDNNCDSIVNFNITEPTPINTNISTNDETCSPGGNGNASATVNGGTPPYSYNWGPGSPDGQGTDSIFNLSASNYSLTITDDNGCQDTLTFTINSGGNIALNESIDDVNCNGGNNGSILLNPLGGTAPYSYLWDDSTTNFLRGGLTAGSYTVTVTDATSCSTIQSFTVTEPDPIATTLTTEDESCSPGNDGWASVSSITGGTPPYSYNWGPGGPLGQGTDSISGLSAGNYSLTITDDNGCQDTLTFTINPGGNIALNESIDDVNCNGGNNGSIILNPLGGTAPYSYLWDDSTTNFLRGGLTAGSYTVTVTDATTCSTIQSFTVTEPDPIATTLTTEDESCSPGNDGWASVSSITGGTAPYSYNWGPGSPDGQGTDSIFNLSAGNYSLTITDDNSCDTILNFMINSVGSGFTFIDSIVNNRCNGNNLGSIEVFGISGGTAPYSFNWGPGNPNGQGTNMITDLAAGSYTLTLTDDNNCDSIVSFNITEPTPISTNLSTNDETCSPGGNGNATATVNGGTPPYSYNWGPGNPDGQGTDSIFNLSAGTYTVTITDDNSCTQVETAIINSGGNLIITDSVVNASCLGVCDGEITLVNIAGGVPPYTYIWNDSNTSPFRTGLCAGSYDVTITDNSSCSTTASYTITNTNSITATINTIPDTCVVGVGSATAIPSGGVTPYSFNWSGGVASGNSVSGLASGNHSVTVTDAGGCEFVDTFSIGNVATFSISLASTDVSCPGNNDGTITVSTVGGTNPMTYDWSGGLVGANPSNVAAGSYTITVTDATGCAEVANVAIFPADTMEATFVTTNESCSPGNDGTAQVNVTGGIPPYSYNWSGGTPSGNTTTGLSVGTYDVTITDDIGCIFVTPPFIINPDAPFSLSAVATDASCNGVNDGSIDLTVTGATPPTSFNWSGGLPNQEDQINLEADIYTVTVTDNSSCSEVLSIEVFESSPVVVVIDDTTDESCSPGNDGTANASASGGVSPYTFAWSGGSGSGNSVSGLTAGGYTVTATDANGCTATETFTINSGSNLDGNANILEPSCFGGSNGSITLTPSGSTNPSPTYSILWDDSSTNLSRTNLVAGTYTATISDNNLPPCEKVETYIVTQPSAITASFTTKSESCSPGNDGEATAILSGGIAPFTFNWSSGVGSGNTVTGLTVGSYSVTITDVNSCSIIETFSIGSSPSFTVSLTSTDPLCVGSSDGTISTTVSGATNPLTYDWSNGLTGGATPTTVSRGTYTVTVTDGNGCTATSSITLNDPPPFQLNSGIINESCNPGNDGSIKIDVQSGAVAPFNFNWGPGNPSGQGTDSIFNLNAGTYFLTLTDANLCDTVLNFTINSVGSGFTFIDSIVNNRCNGDSLGSIEVFNISGGTAPYSFNWGPGNPNGQGTNMITDLAAGSYTLTLTDDNNCDSIVNFNITEPTPISTNLSTNDETCSPGGDGNATATVNGGTPPYSYNWGPGSPDGQGTDSIFNLSASNYSLTITDDNGCQDTLTFTINSGGNLDLNDTIVDVDCNGDSTGSITLSPSGGVAPYTFVWDDATNNSFRTGLAAGSYTVTMTDNNSCSRIESFSITEPTAVSPNLITEDADCATSNGTAKVSPVGGTPPYSFNWGPVSPTGQGTDSISNLATGTYFLTITDDNSCDTVLNFTINSVGSGFTFIDSITNNPCFGDNLGNIEILNINGGTPPYTFAWSNAGAGTTNINSNLVAGTYTLTLSDASSCDSIVTFNITEPTALTASFTNVDEDCGLANGSSCAGVSGGTPPYSYLWPNASTTPCITNLTAGTYTVTIIDANNCVLVETTTIGSTPNYTVDIDTINVTCNGGNDGAINITVGPTAVSPVTYTWSPAGLSGSNPTGLTAGNYALTVTDATGCSGTFNIPITEPNAIQPNLITADDGCGVLQICQGFAKASPTGGTSPYSYSWNGPNGPIAGADSIGSLCAGNYSLTITDDQGCDTTVNFIINPKGTIVPTVLTNNESCENACDGTIDLSASGGQTPYSYNWSIPVGNTPNVSGLCAGTYSVTITDAVSCDTSITITIDTDSIEYTINKTDLSCNGIFDGSADVSIVGGNAGFTFNWNPAPGSGQGTASVSGLAAAKYFVTIDNGSGCSAIDSVTINPSTPILPNESSTNESCNGSCDGSISFNPSGGAGSPYSYNWSPIPPNGQGVSNATGLCAGNYAVTITDVSGCDTIVSIDIQSSSSVVATIGVDDQSCGGPSAICDGRAFIETISGGTPPYTYTWSTGTVVGTNQDTTEAVCTGGPYDVTITDANGCTSVETFTIGAPTPITATFTTNPAGCNVCDGEISVNASGGSPAYSYELFNQSMTSIGIISGNTVDTLCAGIYFIEITDSENCAEMFSVGLSNSGAEVIDSIVAADVSCFGGNDGTATAFFNCDNPTCSVEWFDASNGQPIGQNTNTANGLKAGDYFVEITNDSGCIVIGSTTIAEPTPFNLTATLNDASCNNSCDGSINVNVSGGTGSYTYNWSPAPLNGQGTNNISGLCSGTYSLTVTDDNGCDSIFSLSIGQPSAISASFNTSDQANCGLADGSITATVIGGTSAVTYDYQWFDGANTLLVGETNARIENISAGTYFLRVRDDNVCEERFTAVLGNIDGPSVQVDSVVGAGCFGGNEGAIFISASGNNAPFTYNWLPNGQTTENIANLSSGTYTVIVTDAIGCTGTESISITDSSELIASITPQDASCGSCNGEATINVNGGTAPYTYLWSNGSTADTTANLCGGSHSVVVTDANGCNKTFSFTINNDGGPNGETITATATSCATSCDGTATVVPIGGTAPYTYFWQHNGSTSNSLSNLCEGTYFLQISDANNCSRTVKVDINSPNRLLIKENITAASCDIIPCDGAINLSVSGGTSPYSYNWAPSPQNDTNAINGLCAGIYNVTVTDVNGCSESSSISISNQGNSVVVEPTFEDVTCHGSCDGSLISNISSTTSLSYQWLNDQGQAIAAADSDLINSVCAGEYVLETTTIPEGCKSYFTIKIEEPDSILLAPSIVKPISCADSCDGALSVSTQGGRILYSFQWSDPNAQTQVPATNLCGGIYTVTATDASGCSATSSISLINPLPLELTINSQTTLDCSSDCDASADISVSGGSAPYQVDWSGGQSGNNPTDLCFGPNVVVVTDAKGCMLMDTVFISANDTLIANVPENNIICDGDSIYLNGEVIGNNITSFGWYLSNQTTLLSSNLDTVISRPLGRYSFYLIASNGNCSDTSEYKVQVVSNPTVGVSSPIRIYKEEVAQIRISNGDQSYLYNWTPSTDLNDSTISEPISSTKETRTYTLTVRDTNNCTYLDSVEVIYSPFFDIPSGITPNGDGKNDVWNIKFLNEFPNATVQIYNRWGELLYEEKNGYNRPWDGTYEGKALPVGTYYYIIDLNHDRFEPITGPITIVR